MTKGRAFALLAAAALALSITAPAAAAPDDAIVQRTRATAGPDGERPELDAEALGLAQRIDAVLHEAVQDLGLTVDVSLRAEIAPEDSEQALVEHARDHWVIAPELARDRGGFVLRLVAVPPGSRVLYVRTQSIEPGEVEMRVVLMMRDLVQAHGGSDAARLVEAASPGGGAQVAERSRSPGRPILALNAALLGGYAGYSVQQASGSSDDRLTYPLAALGAGVGLGGSMLVADEWDIGVGDAWYLSAGMWWPTLSGWLLSESYGATDRERYAYGLLGATGGVALATGVLGFGHVDDGGAALAHSGGAFGTLLGGILELAIEGVTDVTPRRGMGYGAGSGVLVAGALATELDLSAARVLSIDLGASLGALAGAAAASPLLLVDEDADAKGRNRLWLASVAAGTIAGGVLGVWATRGAERPKRAEPAPILPDVGVVGFSPEGRPVLGAGVRGAW